jgi:hypothetical protein
MAARSKARNVVARLSTGITGSNPTRSMDVLPGSSVFVLPCVGSGLEMGWSPVQGVLPTVYKIHNFWINSEWEQARKPNASTWKENNFKIHIKCHNICSLFPSQLRVG